MSRRSMLHRMGLEIAVVPLLTVLAVVVAVALLLDEACAWILNSTSLSQVNTALHETCPGETIAHLAYCTLCRTPSTLFLSLSEASVSKGRIRSSRDHVRRT